MAEDREWDELRDVLDRIEGRPRTVDPLATDIYGPMPTSSLRDLYLNQQGGTTSGATTNPVMNAINLGRGLVNTAQTLSNLGRSGGGGGGGAGVGGAAGALGGALGAGGAIQTALPGGTFGGSGGVGTNLLFSGGEAVGGGLGTGAGGAGLLGPLAAWAGPTAIGLGILGTIPEWGGGQGFNRSKDQVRESMRAMGPDAAAQAIIDQADHRRITWSSPSDATSPLNLLDSFGDIFGHDHPYFGQIEENLYRRTVPAGSRDVTEADFPDILGDAKSFGVLPARGQEFGAWRSHPGRPYKYWFRQTPEDEALERDIEAEFAQGRGTENYSADQLPRLDPSLRGAYEERHPDVAARVRGRLFPPPVFGQGEA